ncbi:MAG: EamA family transporter [Chloroflexi bacterium]|nr:EamA family transporter [Chloroflexota bacterium]
MQHVEKTSMTARSRLIRSRVGGIPVDTLLLILAATVLGVIGQLLLKHGMGGMGPLSVSLVGVPKIVWQIATSPFVVGGLLMYVIGTFFWLITLSRLDLSFAYPFVSLNQVLVFIASWLVLHEEVNPLRALGMFVICIGILLVARS